MGSTLMAQFKAVAYSKHEIYASEWQLDWMDHEQLSLEIEKHMPWHTRRRLGF